MSEQRADDELALPDLQAGDAWGESITKHRAVELETLLQEWEAEKEHGKRRSPFDMLIFNFDRWSRFDLRLTGADVFWLAARASAGTSEMRPIAHVAELIRANTYVDNKDMLHLEGAHLDGANLQGANLDWAHLAEASLHEAHLEGAHLNWAHLRGTGLRKAHLEGVSLHEAHLEGAYFSEAHLEGASLHEAHLEGADFSWAHLEGAYFLGAHLDKALLYAAHLEGAILREMSLKNTYFHGAHLEGATLILAHLEGAILREAHLEGKRLPAEDAARIRQWVQDFPDVLPPASIYGAFFDSSTTFNDVVLGDEKLGYVPLADVRWGDANLAVVDWTQTRRGFLGIRKHIEAIELGDERVARTPTNWAGKPKNAGEWITGYKDAVRANRQLATVLRNQGLNEDADRFAYKAQKLQRQVLRRQQRHGAAFGSWLLDLVAGYGYMPMRTLTVYLLALISFAIAYFILGQTLGPHLSPLGAFVFSMTSFHGRGFFPGGIVLDDPITVLAAFEAFVGLVVEVSFIATFTQRFFAR